MKSPFFRNGKTYLSYFTGWPPRHLLARCFNLYATSARVLSSAPVWVFNWKRAKIRIRHKLHFSKKSLMKPHFFERESTISLQCILRYLFFFIVQPRTSYRLPSMGSLLKAGLWTFACYASRYSSLLSGKNWITLRIFMICSCNRKQNRIKSRATFWQEMFNWGYHRLRPYSNAGKIICTSASQIYGSPYLCLPLIDLIAA